MSTEPMPDVPGIVLALDQAMIAIAVAKSALLGETSPSYDEGKHGRYDAASEPALCQATSAGLLSPGGLRYVCGRSAGHDGWHQDSNGPEWRDLPAGHLPQHKGGQPECTSPGCGQPSHLAPPAGYGLKSIEVPTGGAA